MISTGVSGLDELLGSGIPRGSRVLYSLEPGVDGQLFMISALNCALTKGRSCLVILPNTTVDAFHSDAVAKCGTRLDTKLKKIAFIDAIDRERIQKSARTPADQMREWKARIQKICRENNVEMIFGYFDLIYEDFGLDGGMDILESARAEQKATLILEHLNLEGTPLLNRFIKDHAFDLVLAVRSSSRPIPHFNYFTLVHCSWAPLTSRSVPFVITNNQIVPYIPKIIVTGPAHAGKTTFVSNASGTMESINRIGSEGDPTTVAMDYGWLRWKDFDITLYGTPGHARFDPLIPPALLHAMGVVLIIDATKPDTLPRARHLIGLIAKRKIPYIIAANRKDLPGTMSPVEIRSLLKIPKEIPIVPISAKQSADVQRVLESLVDYITQYSS
jgi:small GTP-binding protein